MNTFQRGSLASAIVDNGNVRRDNGHQVSWDHVSQDRRPGPAYTITTNGAAAAAAETITVLPLPVALPAGTALDFGAHSGTSNQMLAITTATAAMNATTISVKPLGAEVEDAAAATYRQFTSDKRVIPAYTIMAMLPDGAGMIPRADVTGTEKAFAILAADAQEDRMSSALTGQGVIVAGIFYEDLLPDHGDPAFATYKEELADAGSFQYRTWYDDTAA